MHNVRIVSGGGAGTTVENPPSHLLQDAEMREAVAALRQSYAEAGQPRGAMCVSRSCLYVATVRVFWPVAPGEPDPVYCDLCAAWARKVLETLGVKYRDEPLEPARTGERRAIGLGAREP